MGREMEQARQTVPENIKPYLDPTKTAGMMAGSLNPGSYKYGDMKDELNQLVAGFKNKTVESSTNVGALKEMPHLKQIQDLTAEYHQKVSHLLNTLLGDGMN